MMNKTIRTIYLMTMPNGIRGPIMCSETAKGPVVEYGTGDSKDLEFTMLEAGQPNLDPPRLDMNLSNSMI
jgi:hypothetical protein